MSRRQSRNSLTSRQNDPLAEFEAFKKKFLLANKHITKLNSTLSIRIEELNAQISTLYVENLRLRASEIALTAQLKREKETTRRVMADAEAATTNLVKRLAHIRDSCNIPQGRRSLSPSPSPPRARFTAATTSPPQIPRLARAPDVPGIPEESEEDEEHGCKSSLTPVIRRTKTRLPGSDTWRQSQTLPATVENKDKEKKKKYTRRQSGLLHSAAIGDELPVQRAGSPVPGGSPIRREAALALEREESDQEEEDIVSTSCATAINENLEANDDLGLIGNTTQNDRKGKERGKEKVDERQSRERKLKVREVDLGTGAESSSSTSSASRGQERKRAVRAPRNDDDHVPPGTSALGVQEGKTLKDVTNSPRDDTLDAAIHLPGLGSQRTSDVEHEPASPRSAAANSRTAHSTSAATSSSTISYLPTPRPSSSPPQEVPPEMAPGAAVETRERRARKSVNYTEPKLNTKMRKPDPLPATSATIKATLSSSSTGAPVAAAPRAIHDRPPAPRASVIAKECAPELLPQSLPPPRPPSAASTTVVRRKKSRPYNINDDDEGAQADVEGWINIDQRRKSGAFGGIGAAGGATWDARDRRRTMAI